MLGMGNDMNRELLKKKGRPTLDREIGIPKDFIKEYKKFQSGQYGNISKKEFARMLGMAISAFYKYENSIREIKVITKQEKKDLRTLADDFRLLHRKDVQEIIENCKSYAEGQQKIMRIYTTVYLS